jgi:cytochrome c551/c552
VPRLIRRALVGLVVAVVLAQLVPITRTNPPVAADVAAPLDVAMVLRRACYDCHSNETVWPWYSRVAPISWLVAHDVDEGRDELNFSAWGAYDAAARRKKLKKTLEEVAEGEMPPWYYVFVHPPARVSPADGERLRAWATEEIASAERLARRSQARPR